MKELDKIMIARQLGKTAITTEFLKQHFQMQKYYIAIDKEDTIWGTAKSPEGAILDSQDSLNGRKYKLKTLECTKEVFDDVNKNGYCHGEDEPYWLYDGMIKMAYYPHKHKRTNVFKSLP